MQPVYSNKHCCADVYYSICFITNLKPITLECNAVVRIVIDKEMCYFNVLSNAEKVLFVTVIPGRKCD